MGRKKNKKNCPNCPKMLLRGQDFSMRREKKHRNETGNITANLAAIKSILLKVFLKSLKVLWGFPWWRSD